MFCTLIMCSLSVVRSKNHNPCDPALGIALLWLAVMLFNQMSNSTGLGCTRQPLNAALNERDLCAHANKHTETHTCTHRPVHAYTLNPFLLHGLSFLVNNFDIRNSPSIVCVCECVSAPGTERGKSHRLNVLFMCLSFILRLRYISREKFSHFKNSPAISEIIGRLLCWADFTSSSIFFFSFPQHAIDLPELSLSPPSLFLLTVCQHVDVSNNNTGPCEWLRSHFGLVSYKTHYNEIQPHYGVTRYLICNVCLTRCRLLC